MTDKNQNLLEYVRRKEYKRRLENYEVWGHVAGRCYSLARIFFTIAFSFVMIINVTYLIYWVNHLTSEYDRLANPGDARNSVIIVSVMSVLLIMDYVLIAKKKPIGYLVCTIIPCIILSVHFYSEMTGIIAGGNLLVYFYKHAAWYILMVAMMAVMLVIQLRETAAENKEYAKLEAALYKHASESSDKNSVFSEGDWEEILKNYDGVRGDVKPMSRSEKIRVRKSAEEDEDA